MTHKLSNKYSLRIVQKDGARDLAIGGIGRPENLDHVEHLCREDFSIVRTRASEERRRGVLADKPYRIELRLNSYPISATVDQDNVTG